MNLRSDQVSLLKQADHLPHQGHDEEWLYLVTKVLGLPECYLPAAQVVLSQGRIPWLRLSGKGHNPVGYVKTAIHREATRQGLAQDRFNSTEPRVKTKDQPERSDWPNGEELCFDVKDSRIGHVELPAVPEGKRYEDHLDALIARAGHNDGDNKRPVIPDWLRRDHQCDSVNWGKVAEHSVPKPRMEAAVRKALELRAAGCSRTNIFAHVANRKEAREIEAAWKWIERNLSTRIAPLFKRDKAPIPTSPASKRPKFVSPSEALQKISLKSQNAMQQMMTIGPSLITKNRNLENFIRDLGLPPNVIGMWTGGWLWLGLERSTTWLRFSLDDLNMPVEILREGLEAIPPERLPDWMRVRRRPISG